MVDRTQKWLIQKGGETKIIYVSSLQSKDKRAEIGREGWSIRSSTFADSPRYQKTFEKQVTKTEFGESGLQQEKEIHEAKRMEQQNISTVDVDVGEKVVRMPLSPEFQQKMEQGQSKIEHDIRREQQIEKEVVTPKEQPKQYLLVEPASSPKTGQPSTISLSGQVIPSQAGATVQEAKAELERYKPEVIPQVSTTKVKTTTPASVKTTTGITAGFGKGTSQPIPSMTTTSLPYKEFKGLEQGTVGLTTIGKDIRVAGWLPKPIKSFVTEHEMLHNIYPSDTESQIVMRQLKREVKTVPSIDTKDIFISPRKGEVKGVIKGVTVSEGVWEAYDKALKTKETISITGMMSIPTQKDLSKDFPFRKPIIDTTITPIITTPLTKPIDSMNIGLDGRFKSVSTSTVTTSKRPYEEVVAEKAFFDLQTQEAERLYKSMTIPEKRVAHVHTFFGGWDIGSEYIASVFDPKIKTEDVIAKRLVKTKFEKELVGESKLKQFGLGAVTGLTSPLGVVETAFLGSAVFGAGITAFGATKIGGAVISSPITQTGMFGLGAYGVGVAGVDVYKDIESGETSKALVKGLTFGASAYVGTKGYKAGQEVYDIWKTRGMKEVHIKDLVPEDVLSGKKIFPEAGTGSMTAKQRAEIQKGLFERESFRLPGQEKPVGFHATPQEWDDLVSLPGKRELEGTYTSYGVSPHFLGIDNKQKIKLFGYETTGGKPAIYAFEPTDIKINIAKQTGKGWDFTQPRQEGILYVPGMKTEVEALFSPGTKFAQTGKDYWVNIYGRRVPIITGKAISGSVVDIPIQSFKTPTIGLAESLGISPSTYLFTPQSLAIAGLTYPKISKTVKSTTKPKSSPMSGFMTGVTKRPKVTEVKEYQFMDVPPGSPVISIPDVTRASQVPYPSKVSVPKSSFISTPKSPPISISSRPSIISKISIPSSPIISVSSKVSIPKSPFISAPSKVSVPKSSFISTPIKMSIPKSPFVSAPISPYKQAYIPYKTPSYISYKIPSYVPYYPPPPPPTPPIIDIDIEPMKYKPLEGFDIEIRKMGKWIKVTREPLLKSEAMKYGGYIIEKTPRASFRLVPSERKPVVTKLPYIFNPARFRKPVKRSRLGKGVFIEKSKYRIDMPGELKGITLKGLETLKTKPKKARKTRKVKSKSKTKTKYKRKTSKRFFKI